MSQGLFITHETNALVLIFFGGINRNAVHSLNNTVNELLKDFNSTQNDLSQTIANNEASAAGINATNTTLSQVDI